MPCLHGDVVGLELSLNYHEDLCKGNRGEQTCHVWGNLSKGVFDSMKLHYCDWL